VEIIIWNLFYVGGIWLETEITKLLKIRYPIIQGGLYGIGIEPLVSAVSEAGGLGLITASSYPSKSEMIKDIERVRMRTKNPFGVNISIGIRNPMDEFVDGICESGVPIVFTSGYSPEKYIRQLKKQNITVIHVVPNLKFAKKAESIGCDAVVAVGYECGGHPGLEETSTMHLIPQLVDELKIPVIAAGGIYDGRGLAAALSLGADGVQMGTRFVMTEESPLHTDIKSIFKLAGTNDTTIIKKTLGKPARVFNSEAAKKVLRLESKGCRIEELLEIIGGESYHEMLETGDINKGVISLGKCIAYIDDIISVKSLIETVIEEAEKSFARINKLDMTNEKRLSMKK